MRAWHAAAAIVLCRAVLAAELPLCAGMPATCRRLRFFQAAPSAAGGVEPATSSAVRRGLLRW